MIEVIALFISAGSSLISAAALAFAAYTYRINRNQLNFAVIANCTDRFQRIMARMKANDEAEKSKAIKQYVDLCNEEMFYFKNGFLPPEIADEWLDGMIYYLPHIVDGANVNPNEVAHQIDLPELSDEYPRVYGALQFDEEFRLNRAPTRLQLVSRVKANVRKSVGVPDVPLLKA